MEANTTTAARGTTATASSNDIDIVGRRIDDRDACVTCSQLEIEIEGIEDLVLSDRSIQGVALDIARIAHSPNHVLTIAQNIGISTTPGSAI